MAFVRSLLGLIAAIAALLVTSGSGGLAPRGPTLLRLEIEARGNVDILLHTAEAPKTTAHIAALVERGFYNGQRFFKVVTSPRPYLVQTGDPASRDATKLDDPTMGTGGSGTKVPYESSGFSNVMGAVGLSTPPNDRNGGDSQFYILLDNAKFLDGSYTVFGKVQSGMDVVKSIRKGDKIVAARIVRS